jgi:peptidoglycan/LPS O-acetylase OafA/YrhL
VKHLIHPSYRPDIDGLRAIAVLSVVGFHAFPKVFKGGFVGVDVFFVISGFLISTIIFENLKNNSFSFIDFYSRRVRRIFPSLIVVLTATLGFGYISLRADEYANLGKHAAGGAGFISNILLWGESGYFDRASETKPLLHLWSLGIEEQFYIVWPLFAYLAWKRRLGFSATAVALALSFAANFYSPFPRFWELLIGALIACLTSKKQLSSRRQTGNHASPGDCPNSLNGIFENKKTCNLISIFGGLLILLSILITRERDFPGFWALMPAMGAALIIFSGRDAWLNKHILSNRHLIFIGLISFPLYLWHWPILSFGNILFGETPPVFSRLIAVLASVLLAWGTYRLVEQPIRNGILEYRKTVVLLILAVIVGGIGYFISASDGFRSRYPAHSNDYENRAWHLKGGGEIIDCTHLVEATTSSFCAKTKDPRVAIIGDSHAGHLFYGFSRSANEEFNKVIVIGAGSCQPALDFEAREGCNSQLKAAIEWIEKNDGIKYVVLSGYYGFIDNEDSEISKEYISGITKTINELEKYGKQIIYFVDTPALKETAERCQPRSLILREAFNPLPEFCYDIKSNNLRDQTAYRKVVNKIMQKNPDVFYFDPRDALCPNNKCNLHSDGKLLYGDWNHLSIYGSQLVVNAFIDARVK